MVALGYVFSLGYGALCLLFAYFLSLRGVDKKITRKLVHIFIGFEWIILYHFHGASYHFLIVCLAFLAILAIAHKKKKLRMISSDGDNAPGTVYYAVSMSLMALVTLFEPHFALPFGVAVFATSLGDGFAGLLGQLASKHNPKVYGNKTLVGVIANFALSTLSALSFSWIYPSLGLSPLFCISIGLLATGVELVCGLGLDNILLPLSVSAVTYFCTACDSAATYLLPIVLTPYVIAFVLQHRALTASGVLAAIVLDLAISIALGNLGFLLLLVFLSLGILTDKIKKTPAHDEEEKGTRRDASQVLANGLVPILSAVLYFAFDERAFLLGFVASLAEALGDTAASSIGSYSRQTFDIFKFRKCEKGMSGGVSLVGTFAAVLFSAIIPLIAFAFDLISLRELFATTAIAILGVFFDSLLGSLLQAKYRCTVCMRLTEKREHCGMPARLASGFAFVRNDTVNAISTLFAATFAIVFYL